MPGSSARGGSSDVIGQYLADEVMRRLEAPAAGLLYYGGASYGHDLRIIEAGKTFGQVHLVMSPAPHHTITVADLTVGLPSPRTRLHDFLLRVNDAALVAMLDAADSPGSSLAAVVEFSDEPGDERRLRLAAEASEELGVEVDVYDREDLEFLGVPDDAFNRADVILRVGDPAA